MTTNTLWTCLSLLVADAKDPETRPSRLRELRALIAVLQHVGENPAAYAEPRPLSRAFASVPDMPPAHDLGALIDELGKLRLFAIEMRDFVAVLLPAELASAKPGRARHVTLGTSVPADIADQVLEAANQRGVTRSAFIASLITEHLANV